MFRQWECLLPDSLGMCIPQGKSYGKALLNPSAMSPLNSWEWHQPGVLVCTLTHTDSEIYPPSQFTIKVIA